MAERLVGFEHPRAAVRVLSLLACAMAIAVGVPSVAKASTPLVWEPSSRLFWSVNGSSIRALFQNGECTQWAAEKRPDIVERIIRRTVRTELKQGQDELIPNLNARYWIQDARRAGIPTGRRPRARSLIVFQPGVLGAGPIGHIAYVFMVRRDGSFRISEMNAPLPFHVTYATLGAWAARLQGVRFIY
jgi:surface antigen